MATLIEPRRPSDALAMTGAAALQEPCDPDAPCLTEQQRNATMVRPLFGAPPPDC